MKPRRRAAGHAEPETSAALVSAVVARLGGESRAREHGAFEAYLAAAGEILRRHTQPESLRGKALFVRASSSAIAHKLTLLRGPLLERIAAALGPDVVTDLRTRVGPLRAKR